MKIFINIIIMVKVISMIFIINMMMIIIIMIGSPGWSGREGIWLGATDHASESKWTWVDGAVSNKQPVC